MAIDYLPDPESIEFFPEDIAEYTSKLKTGEKTLLSYPKILRNNPAIISAAIEFDGSAIQYASHKLANYKEMALKAVKKDGMALRFLGYPLNQDETMIEAAVKQNSHAIQFIPLFREIIPLFKSALALDISTVRHFPKLIYRETEEFDFLLPLVLKGIKEKKITLEDLPLYLRNDPKIVLKAVQNSGLDLKHASEMIKENIEIVSAAASHNIYALEFASPNLKLNQIYSTKEKFNQLINDFKSGKHTFTSLSNTKLLPNIFRDNKEVALAAVSKDGSAIQYVSESLRKDLDIVKASKNKLW